jgi:hypothetical protein
MGEAARARALADWDREAILGRFEQALLGAFSAEVGTGSA